MLIVQKVIKMTSLSNTIVFAGMFFHYDELKFESIPDIVSCCHEYSLEHQMCTNPWLKIVPPKKTLFTPARVTFAETYSLESPSFL